MAIVLNHLNHYIPAALILIALLWGVSIFNLIDGAGLSDPGIAVFPLLIVLSGFLFNQWFVALTSLLSCATVWMYYLADATGWLVEKTNPTSSRAAILSVLYVISGVLFATIYDNWDRTQRALRESYDLTLEGWAQVLELRDFETKGHSDRVERLAVALAEELGCTSDEIKQIRRGAYLHDIGKIGIRDELLFKRGPLTDAEWDDMKRHPALGRQMIAKIPFLRPTHDIIYSHHERWDGEGYPEGLQGEEIPYWARIFALVDQWDALTSDRPYRKAWSREQVMRYIKQNTGIIFDPEMVTVFLNLIENYN